MGGYIDDSLKQAIEIAIGRGSKYVKGQTAIDELPEKVAELGIYLLSRAKILNGLKGARLKEELNEIQSKIDDLRKDIFYSKAKKSSEMQ